MFFVLLGYCSNSHRNQKTHPKKQGFFANYVHAKAGIVWDEVIVQVIEHMLCMEKVLGKVGKKHSEILESLC